MMRKLLFHRLLLPVLFALSCSCLAADTPKLTVIADREMPKYQCGETVVFYISAVNADGTPITSGTLDYQLKLCSRCDLTLRSGKIELGEKPVEFKATLEEPGFLYLRVSGTLDGKKLWAAGGAAFEPEKLTPLQEEPADFDRFWAETLARQNACPPVELEKLEQFSNEERNCYLVKVPTPDGQTIYGFLSEPARPGRYPAVVNLPGAGAGYYGPDTEWPAEGVIALRMNVHTYRPADSYPAIQKQYKEAYGTKLNYLRQNTEDREKHVYFRSHPAISRAIDFVASRPNFDGRHFVAYGGSQGGTLGMAMAALNSRLTAVAALVPGFGDHAGFLKGRSNSHLLYPVRNEPERLEKAKAVAGYYDSAFFARRAKIPVLMSAGYIDPTCTPASVYVIYNQIPGEKRMIDCPRDPHGISKELRAEMMAFIREHLGLAKKAE